MKIWRRSFDVPPLAMEEDHEYYQTIQKDARYADIAAVVLGWSTRVYC